MNTGRNPTARTRPRPSFRQTRHLASHNISTIVHETLNFDILDENHDVTHVVRHRSGIRVWLAEHPSELCDFHSQSQGRCWYVRTALETLSTQIGGEWSATRAKENYWTLLESEFDSGSTSHLFDTPGFDSMIATISWRQMHKTIIFCLNFARQLQTNHEQTCTQNRPKHPRVDS